MEHHNNAKFAFFYMLSLVALVFMAISTGMIIFQIINKTVTDMINFAGSYNSGILKFAISAIIIATPIYYVTMRQINKNLHSGILNKDSGVRKWLTHLILFVVSVVVIGWLIATINMFLNGEITLKFILKLITVIGISAVIFTYYLYDIKRESVNKKDKITSIYFYLSLILVIASFVTALFFVESPAQARERKHDDMILSDFDRIDSAINEYYRINKELPSALDILVDENKYYLETENLSNQITEEVYNYEIIKDNDYHLCATFKASTKEKSKDLDMRYQYNGHWAHEAGYQCLEQTIVDFSTSELPVRVK
ncbi:MAG: DUF5671 domain-containing protein [bacterium]